MEKTGEVRPGKTPDIERKLAGEKQADAKSKIERLDDDFSKRAANATTDGLRSGQR